MKNNDQTTATNPQDLLNELHALVAEAEKRVNGTEAEPNQDLAGWRARFDAAQERLSGLYTGARQKVVVGARRTDEAIRANPYQSLAIAAGVGLLVGLLAGRRSK